MAEHQQSQKNWQVVSGLAVAAGGAGKDWPGGSLNNWKWMPSVEEVKDHKESRG